MPEPSGTPQKSYPPPRTSESGFSTGPLHAPTDIRHRTPGMAKILITKSGQIGMCETTGEICKTVTIQKWSFGTMSAFSMSTTVTGESALMSEMNL